LFGPTGTPLRIIERLHAELTNITTDQEFVKKNYLARAIEPAAGTRAEFINFITENRKSAAVIARDTGLQPK
jgi:tripartite-type tricarboxylate transporter receptor subunit TctC